MLYTRNQHNIVNQLYSSKKNQKLSNVLWWIFATMEHKMGNMHMKHLIHAHNLAKLDPHFNWSYLEMLKDCFTVSFWFLFLMFYHFLLSAKLSHFEILGISYNYSKRTYSIETCLDWLEILWMNEWNNKLSWQSSFSEKMCFLFVFLFVLYFLWW